LSNLSTVTPIKSPIRNISSRSVTPKKDFLTKNKKTNLFADIKKASFFDKTPKKTINLSKH
jgi:hypothetical protein